MGFIWLYVAQVQIRCFVLDKAELLRGAHALATLTCIVRCLYLVLRIPFLCLALGRRLCHSQTTRLGCFIQNICQ